jgi:cysteine synthase
MKYDNILQTIGNTPVVKLNRFGPDHVQMYVKVESFNPMASVKDRLAYAIIKDARDSGALQPGQTVIEATSGNTGIALAMVCAVMGHPFVAVMVETFSIERRKLMRALGGKVILTPAAERGTGMVKRAEALAAEHGWFMANQFKNPANPNYHASTTGPSAWTTGSLAGAQVARCLAQEEPSKLHAPQYKLLPQNPNKQRYFLVANGHLTKSRDGPPTSFQKFWTRTSQTKLLQ